MAGNQNTAYTEKGLRALLTQFKEKPETNGFESSLTAAKNTGTPSAWQTSAAPSRGPEKAINLDEMYEQTVKTLTMTPDVKNYSGLNPIEDAKKLMELYEDTLYRSVILNKDSPKGKNPLAIAQREYDNALSTTMARYQVNGLDAQGMQDWLSRSGFQTQGDVDRLNEQNMITAARKMQNAAARDKYLNGPEGAAGLADWANEVTYWEKNAPALLDTLAQGGTISREDEERLAQLTGISPMELPMRTGDAMSAIRGRMDELLGASNSGTAQGARDYLQKNGYNLGFLEKHPNDAQEYLDFYRDVPRIAQMVLEHREDELTDRELELWDSDSALRGNLMSGEMGDPMERVESYAADMANSIQNALGLNNAAWQPTDAQRYVYSQYLDTLEGAQEYAKESKGTAREQQAKDNLWFVENREKFGKLKEIPEYESKAEYDRNYTVNGNSLEDKIYHWVNRLNSFDIDEQGHKHYVHSIDENLSVDYGYLDYMSAEERANYNALVKDGRLEDAKAYREYLSYDLYKKMNAARETMAQNMASRGPLEQAAASLASIPYSLTRGFGTMDIYAQSLRNALSPDAQYRPVNYEKAAQEGRTADALREAVMNNVNWGTQILGQDVDLFDFLYGTTMSGADSLAAGLAGPAAGAMILGAGAAQSTMDDLYKNGATDQQILIGGTAAGIFETLFEKMSLGAFYDEANALTKPTFTAHLKNIGAQMGINFSEEFNTELANILFDQGLMGEDSKSSRQIKEYLQLGMTETEAKQKVAEELTWQCLEAGLGGALMGAGFGALSNISSSANYRGHTQELGARFSTETKGSLWDIAKTLGVERANKTSAEQATNKQVGQVYRDVVKRLPENMRAPLQESMKRDALNAMKRMGGTADGESAGSAVIALLEGRELTDAQTDALAGDKLTMQVIQDLLGANETDAAAETEAQERPEEKQEAQEEEPWEAPPEGAEFAGNEETDAGAGLRYDTPAGADLGMDAQRRAGEKARREQNPAILEGKLKTGETAAIQRVEMNEDTMRPQAVLEDGQTISLDDMDLTQEEQILLNAAADMNEEAGRDLMRLSPDGGSVTDYARGYKQVYSSAAEGRGLNDLQTAQTATLSDAQRRAAWEAGRREWERKNGGGREESIQQLPEGKSFAFATRGGDSLNVKSAAESAEGTVEITTEDGNTLALDEADLADEDKTILREAAQMEDQEAAAAMIRAWQDEQKARTRAAAGNRIQSRLTAEDSAKTDAQRIDQEARRAEEQRKAKEAIDQAYEAAIRERERLAAEAEEKARAAQERQRKADEAERQAKAAADAAQEAREAEENARQAAQAEREAEEARERQEQADEADRQEKAAIDQAYEAALQEQARLEAEAEEKARAAQERQRQADEAERQAKAAADAAQEAREAEENARRAEEEAKRAKEAADKEAALQEAQRKAKDEIDRAYEAAIREQERLAAEAEQKTRDAQAQQQKAEEAEKAAKAAADAAQEAREAEENARRAEEEEQRAKEVAGSEAAQQEAQQAAKAEIDRVYEERLREKARRDAEAQQKEQAAQEERRKAEEALQAAKAAADAARQAKEEAEKKAAARKESKLAALGAEEQKARQRADLLAEQAKAQQEADALAQEALEATKKAEKAKADAERKAQKLSSVEATRATDEAYAAMLADQAQAQKDADALAQAALEATRKAEKAKADAERKAQKLQALEEAENDAQTFARGFRRVYEAAASGKKLESIYGELLTDSQRQAAQAAGEAARERRENKIAALNAKAAKESGFRVLTKETGDAAGLYFARVTARTRGPETDVQLRLIDLFARETGMQVRVYDTLGDANASYTQGTNIVNLGLDAEDGALTRAVSHEGYHFINQWSPGQGLKIKNFVLDALATRPEYDLEGRIREIQERYSRGGQELSRAKAEEEIVGNSLLDVIGTEENLKSLFKKDQTLAEKIGEWAKKTAGLLKGLVQRYAKHNRVTADALRVSEQMQGIADMYLQAAKNAGQNFLRAGLGMNETARSDADIREYEQDMKKATDNDDARANLEALLNKLYLRAEQGWIGSNTEQYENGFERFKGALRAYMAKENPVALSVALERAGLDAQPAEMNPQLTYAARQLADADERRITRLPEEAFNLKDDEYMKAVENGDVEAAQEMADEAAKAAGYTPVTRYHQTGKEFTEFKTDNPVAGANDSETPNGIFFKENDHDIGVGGDYVNTGHGGGFQMRVYLKADNMLHFKNRTEAVAWYKKNVQGYQELRDEWEQLYNEKYKPQFDALEEEEFDKGTTPERMEELFEIEEKLIQEMGKEERENAREQRALLDEYFLHGNSPYDGIELDYDGHRYIDGKRENVHTFIVFDAYQAKSADAITYDDAGNVIPLSQRFNTQSNDIRYNLKDDEYMQAVESGDTEAAREMVDEASKKAGYVLTSYHGTSEYFNEFRRGFEGIHMGTQEVAEQVAQNRFDWRSKKKSYVWKDIRSRLNEMDEEARASLVHEAYLLTDYIQDLVDIEPYKGDLADTKTVVDYVDNIVQRYEQQNQGGWYGKGKTKINMRTFDRKTGAHVLKLYAKISNPFVVNGDIMQWDAGNIAEVLLKRGQNTEQWDLGDSIADISGSDVLLTNGQIETLEKIYNYEIKGDEAWDALADVLGEMGYDGIKYKNQAEGDKNSWSYIALHPSDVKSADPVTYDDAGNVIPLSQRFNTQSNDIRYNLKDDGGDIVNDVKDDADLYAQAMSDQEIRDSLESAGRLLAFIQQNSLRQKDTESWKKWAREYAKKVLAETGSKYSAQKLQKELNQVYEAIDKGGYNGGELLIRLRELGRRVLEAAPGVVVEMDETTRAARDALKTGAFYLTDDQKEAIQLRYGSLGAYMRKNFGKLAIRKRAQGAQKGARASLADVWTESLSPLLPSVFAQDTIEADMPEIIDAFLETSGEKKYAGEFGRNIGQYATSLGLEMLRDYLNAPFIQESIGKLREGMEARVGDAYQREQEARARAAALQESFRSKTEGIREHYKEKYDQRIQRDKERRENTAERQSAIKDIQGKVRRINTMTVNPTNQRHVPEELRGAAISAIRPFLSNTSVFSRADLDRLSTEYAALMERKGELTGLDADILDDIRGMAETMEGKRLSQLTNAEISAVQDVIGNLYKVITEQNEAKVNGQKTTIDLLSGQMKEDMRKMGDAKTGPIRDKIRWLMLREMTPIYFADNAGGTLKAMIKDFFGGMETWMNLAEAAKEAESALVEKYRVNDWINDKNTLRFTSQRGERLELSRREALSLYALWKRETTNKIQNAKHLQIGGFTYEKGARYQGVDTLRPHIIAQSDMDQVRSFLGKSQMAFADEMVKYLTEALGEEGNKVSMELYGFKKFKEGYYFPYETDRHYLVGELTQTGERTRQPKDQGMSKATLKNAATPIMLHDFFQVWGNHVNNMGLYAGFAQSVDLMNRVLNDRISAEVTMDPATNLLKVLPAESNWAAMARAMGDEGVQYLKTLVKDVAGGVRADERGFAAKGLTMMKKASVAANLSVALQQPTAYARAMLMVNPRYMMVTPADLAKLPQRIRTMYEYSGVAKIKRMGKFDTGTGKGAVAWITEPVNDPSKTKRALEKIDDVTGIGAEKADEWTWGILWGAIEKETQNTRAELKPGTKEFYRAVKERFEDVVNHTQVYDSVLSRSEWMRSNTTMDKMLTSFMAEPTLSLNMLMDSFRKIKSPGGKKIAARAAGVFLVNALLTALAKGIMTATRKKDEEGKTWTEKYLAAAAGEFMEDISPFGLAGMIPWARDVVSLLEGYDVERSDMDAVEMLVNAYKTLTNENKSAEDKIQAISGAVGNVFGIPLKNIWRDGEAILRNMFGGASAAEPTSPGALKYSVLDELKMGPISLWDSSRNAYYDRMENALINGNEEEYEELKAYMVQTEGVKENSVKDGIKSQLKDSLNKGLISDDKAIDILDKYLQTDSQDKDDAFFTVEKWKQEKANEGDDEYSYKRYGEVLDAVKSGQPISREAKEKLTEHGVEEKEITSAIKSQIGEWYRKGEMTKAEATSRIKQYLGVTDSDELYWMFDEWDYNAKKGKGDENYSKYMDVFAAVKSGKSADAAIRELTGHGYDEKDVRSAIKSQIGEWYKKGEVTKAEAEKKLKQYAKITDANDLYWMFDKLDYEKANAKNKNAPEYAKYMKYDQCVETGSGLIQETKRLLEHGVKAETVASHITSIFKPLYIEAYKRSKTEAANLKARILTAYEALGYDRDKKNKDVDAWLK